MIFIPGKLALHKYALLCVVIKVKKSVNLEYLFFYMLVFHGFSVISWKNAGSKSKKNRKLQSVHSG